MKKIILVALILLEGSLFAANYGKFKINIPADYVGPYEAQFLLNSAGDIRFLQNDSYMEVEAYNFFGETSLSIRSIGDEEFMKALITIKNNRIIRSCSAFIDLKNRYYMDYGTTGIRLYRWNKKVKRYEAAPMNGSTESSYNICFETLVDSYSDFEQL